MKRLVKVLVALSLAAAMLALAACAPRTEAPPDPTSTPQDTQSGGTSPSPSANPNGNAEPPKPTPTPVKPIDGLDEATSEHIYDMADIFKSIIVTLGGDDAYEKYDPADKDFVWDAVKTYFAMFGSKHTTITDQRTYVVDDDLVEDIAEYMFDDADDDSLPKPDDAELKNGVHYDSATEKYTFRALSLNDAKLKFVKAETGDNGVISVTIEGTVMSMSTSTSKAPGIKTSSYTFKLKPEDMDDDDELFRYEIVDVTKADSAGGQTAAPDSDKTDG